MRKNPVFFIIFILANFALWVCDASRLSAAESPYILSLQNETGEQLLNLPIRNGECFAIRFIHSVAGTPVTDYFTVREGKIFLDKTIYHDFGAGLPHFPEDGQQMKTVNGEISITGFNREMPNLEVRVGRVANHELLLFENNNDSRPGRQIPLNTLSRPGSAIIFLVKKVL